MSWLPKRAKRKGPRLQLGMGRLFSVLVFTVALTALGIYQVSAQHDVIRMGYLLDQELFTYRRLQEVRKRLDLAAASHKHPAAVTDYAADKLEMREPSNRDQFVVPVEEPPGHEPEDVAPEQPRDDTDPGGNEP